MKSLVAKRIKVISFLGTLTLSSFALIAKPALKTIKAHINSAISYTLNGHKVLEDTQTIIYKDEIYISLADAAKLMNMEVMLKKNLVMMTTQVLEMPQEQVIIEEAVIKAVDAASKKAIILKKESEDIIENYIVLNITDQTKIIHEVDDNLYTLQDLKEEMIVSVKHAQGMTFSLPPQTEVFEIKILHTKYKKDQTEQTIEMPEIPMG